MKCPKCGTESLLIHERQDRDCFPHTDVNGETHFPSLEDIIASRQAYLFGEGFDKLYECRTHGEFGVKADGTSEFADPDTWVEGPNGEKLFRS